MQPAISMCCKAAYLPISPFQPALKRTRHSAMRSEERRVGKEVRSLCDWSSDVCSSDLKGEIVDFPRKQKVGEGAKGDIPVAVSGVTGFGGSIRVDAAGNIYVLQGGIPADFPVPAGFEKDEAFRNEIGRASCRERGEITV